MCDWSGEGDRMRTPGRDKEVNGRMGMVNVIEVVALLILNRSHAVAAERGPIGKVDGEGLLLLKRVGSTVVEVADLLEGVWFDIAASLSGQPQLTGGMVDLKPLSRYGVPIEQVAVVGGGSSRVSHHCAKVQGLGKNRLGH